MSHGNHKGRAHGGTCLNCGGVLSGAFCAACGQSAHEGREPGIGHFLHDLVHEFLHLDGKVFRTLKALLFEPGRLTDEYWKGRIASWVRPIRLFLVAAAVHWLASTGVGPLNLQVILERETSGELSVSIASEPSKMAGKKGRVAATAEEHEAFLEKFRHTYSQIRYFSVVLFAGVSWLIYRRRQRHYVNHLIGALHFYAFWYLTAILSNELMRVSPTLEGVGMILSAVYLVIALRRLFGESRLRSTAMAGLLIAALGLIELGLGLVAASQVVKQGRLQSAPAVHGSAS
jgi:hypothetical protein